VQTKNLSSNYTEVLFKALIVSLILNAKVEQAVELLAKRYKTTAPKIQVGMPKSHGKHVYGCYTGKNQTIYLRDSEILKEPFVILHEFYHHLRTSVDNKHRGTEKYANTFAKEFIEAYSSLNTHRSARP
jgi:Zn-dependent peptidase ImmA (M78 family)